LSAIFIGDFLRPFSVHESEKIFEKYRAKLKVKCAKMEQYAPFGFDIDDNEE